MYKRLINILLVLVLLISGFLINLPTTIASTDATGPTVKNVTIDKEEVQAGENILIQVEAEDLESGIAEGWVTVRRVWVSDYSVDLSYNNVTEKYEGTFTVPKNAVNGDWAVIQIVLKDKVGNLLQLVQDCLPFFVYIPRMRVGLALDKFPTHLLIPYTFQCTLEITYFPRLVLRKCRA